ncbi:RNA polymerase sigma-70 factor (ECF subfamily) [Neorhizobium galegae]|uniref:RNA polymerase sigma factor n=1 Tax=Neorhizobium galegae TaxID=399 RepID=UPI001EB66C11|nr:RNA polymerase sigma factor [Neorhizobium galegae]MBP2562219.1 RNA polymerase sigma-70 factor (ECF subfamily) [Neorhizobium galegae]
MYMEHRKALVDYAVPLTGSRDEAEDIVQEAFLRFVPDQDEEPTPPKTYLYRIVRNLSFNARSRKKRERAVDPGDIPWWALPQFVDTPENDLLFCEQVKRVASVIESLPDRERTVLQMYRHEGLTMSEIADRLKISAPTVYRLLKNAMEEIRQHMALGQ